MQCINSACYFRCSVVCVYVCLLFTVMSCAKTAKPVEMLFGMWACVGPRNHVLGPDPPRERGNLGHLSAYCEVYGMSRMSQRYLVGDSSNAAFYGQYCWNLFYYVAYYVHKDYTSQ